MPGIRRFLIAVVTVAASLGAGGMASAAPVPPYGGPRDAATAARPFVQDVHWVWRHHHRYWVADRPHHPIHH
jgi:hypothetical protein